MFTRHADSLWSYYSMGFSILIIETYCARVLNRFYVQLCLRSIKNSRRQLCSTQACVMTDGENLFMLTFQQSYSARLQVFLAIGKLKVGDSAFNFDPSAQTNETSHL